MLVRSGNPGLWEQLLGKAGVQKFPKEHKYKLVEPPSRRALRCHAWVVERQWLPLGVRLYSTLELMRAMAHKWAVMHPVKMATAPEVEAAMRILAPDGFTHTSEAYSIATAAGGRTDYWWVRTGFVPYSDPPKLPSYWEFLRDSLSTYRGLRWLRRK